MRRTDKEIADRSEIDSIIRGCQVCHLALARRDEPYVIPVSFGYDGAAIYFHTAREGTKIDFIRSNPRVCFQLEQNVNLVADESDACRFTFSFESVIGYGDAVELLDPEEKANGLNQIMLHYTDREWSFDDSILANTRVWRIAVGTVTGKRSRQNPGQE